MKKIVKIISVLSFFAFIGLSLAILVGFVDVSALMGGSTLAMAAGAGTTIEGEAATTTEVKEVSSELLDNSIRKNITKMKPSATPLDTIIRNVGLVVPVKSWETEWYAVDSRGIADTVKTEFAASSGTNAVWTIHDLIVTNIHIWSIDDNVLIPGKNGNDSKPLVLHVVGKVASTNTLAVVAVNGTGSHDADIPKLIVTTALTRIGNAKSELDAQTSPYAVFPQKSSNYCQVHMAQVEESLYDRLHEKEVNWDITDYRAESIYDMKRSMELTSIFGAKLKLYDSVGEDWKYLSGGITRYITKGLTYTSGSLNKAQYLAWNKSIFDGNSGSDVRVLFAGSTLLAELLACETVYRQVEGRNVEVMFGIKFNKIETNFGTLLVKHHKLFNDCGWTTKGLVLDIANLEKHIFKPLQTKSLELQKTGIKNANAFVLDEAFCLATRYPDTHATIALA